MQISSKKNTAVTFDDPIGMLKACHQRMLDFCALLERMFEYQKSNGADTSMQQSAIKIMRYFDTAAHLHHLDEELDLFPELIALPQFKTIIQQLTLEHVKHDELWKNLRPSLHKIKEGQLSESLENDVIPFIKAFRDHIQIENENILSDAEKFIDPAILKKIGQAMSQRRQTSTD